MSYKGRHGESCSCDECEEARIRLVIETKQPEPAPAHVEDAEDLADFAEMEEAWRNYQCRD